MAPQIGYTPPDLPAGPGGAVRRRQVFYLPGYDPEANKRYRALFVRELSRYGRRFDLPRRRVSPARTSPDGLVQSWTVEAGRDGRETDVAYEVLLWDDLVRRDFARPLPVSMLLLTVGILHAAVTGKLFRLYALNWKYGNVILYPFVMTMMILALGIGLGLGVAAAIAGGGAALPLWARAGLGLAGGLGALVVATPLLDRIFLRQLINDWVFNWQHSNGWRPDYEARLAVFADHVASRIEAEPADEVMIVGHSSGALTAVELAARVVARTDRPLSLLTLGAGLPLVAVNPRARPVRDAIAALLDSDRVVWADYQAPQDWMNFPGFNPGRHLGLPARPRTTNPLIRSARFSDIMERAAYDRVKARPFRMHFQFLMSNDLPGEFDFFALLLGPQRLRERVLAPEVVPARADAGPAPATEHREI
ncbi:alpha/beta fold hydrolase [Methylobacterium sp. JK268]